MEILMLVLIIIAVSLVGIFMISYCSKHTFSPVRFVEYPTYAPFAHQNKQAVSFAPSSRSQMKARLAVFSGPKRGTTMILSEPSLMIERNSKKLALEDPLISRYHAMLEYKDGMWFIQDLDSTNGTFLNDKRLTPRRLARVQDGSILEVGETRIAFSQVH